MISWIDLVSQAMIVAALILTLFRLVKGPSSFDRLLAGETMALGLIGLILVQAGIREARLYVDAALSLALFSFVGVVVFARFLEQGEIDD
ncbi:MAG: monovalent cation/H+ antiporter complex subunit F [Acidobacteriota bacterium]